MRAPVALLPPSSGSAPPIVAFFKTASRSSVLLLAFDSAYRFIVIRINIGVMQFLFKIKSVKQSTNFFGLGF